MTDPRPPPGERALLTVFGATGDLMQRKLLPSIYALAHPHRGGAPGPLVLGVARHPHDDAAFQASSGAALRASGAGPARSVLDWCRDALRYHSLGAGAPSDYRHLGARFAALEEEHGLSGDRVFYLALPSDAVPGTVRRLGEAGLARGPGWTRLVVEKPFGRDLASARRLNSLIHRYFDETQVYRIDHYLGKETVQNLLVFRFANMLFESVWSRDRVDHVEITVAEELGVEDRAAYFDGAGVLRDMVQSHLTQLLCLTAMEVPASMQADAVRNEKVKVLRSIGPIRPDDVVRGQYRPGVVRGRRVPGYREEPGVRRTSTTETYVALRLLVKSWRWQGIPFLLRTGKRLPQKATQIVVHFRKPPVWFFPHRDPSELGANRLTITLQPDEGFELAFEVKKPGHAIRLRTEKLHFRYAEAFGPLADAYQTLLLDLFRGDQTLFVRADEVEESWRIYDGLLRRPGRLHPYAAGTWGPAAAERLATDGGHEWAAP